MKLESLIVIFLLIIIPITVVLSEYVDKRIEAEKTEISYNTKLLNSTHDAIKEYQLRTVNNEFSYDTNNKILHIESAINTFFTSLSSNFGYSGYNTETMKAYVPAFVFTLYDGYYIYSPYRNTLTDIKNKDIDGVTDPDYIGYDSSYSKEGENYYGLKPYVYYSCRYKYGTNNDFIITYTLDNYITIQGTINGTYAYDYGYLYDIDNGVNSITKTANGYTYGGVEFTSNDTEELQEYVEDNIYSYVKINGTKYYLEKSKFDNGNHKIFYIDKYGKRNYDQFKTNRVDNDLAYKAITQNKSAYEYYKNAYEFSARVLGNLREIKSSDALYYKENNVNGTINLKDFGDFDIFGGDNPPQFEDSNFNKHRKSIIRYVVETNLLPAITSYASNSKSVGEFIMPKISDTDWDLIENNVCGISFMQGMNIGSKRYNGYSVVANSLTKEYVDEDDIYIIKGNTTYYRVNDKESSVPYKKTKYNIGDGINHKGFYAGILKLDFEQRKILNNESQTIYYYPQHHLGSYTSIFGSNGITPIQKDMYQYISSLDANVDKNKKIKEIYYKALGRERWESFNINNINSEKYVNNDPKYFLESYKNP